MPKEEKLRSRSKTEGSRKDVWSPCPQRAPLLSRLEEATVSTHESAQMSLPSVRHSPSPQEVLSCSINHAAHGLLADRLMPGFSFGHRETDVDIITTLNTV